MQISPINSYQNNVNFKSKKCPLLQIPSRVARVLKKSPDCVHEVVMEAKKTPKGVIQYYLIRLLLTGEEESSQTIKIKNHGLAMSIFTALGQAAIDAKSELSKATERKLGMWTPGLKLRQTAGDG